MFLFAKWEAGLYLGLLFFGAIIVALAFLAVGLLVGIPMLLEADFWRMEVWIIPLPLIVLIPVIALVLTILDTMGKLEESPPGTTNVPNDFQA